EPGQVRGYDAVLIGEPEHHRQQRCCGGAEAVQAHEGRGVTVARLDVGRAYAERSHDARTRMVGWSLRGECAVELQAQRQVAADEDPAVEEGRRTGLASVQDGAER